LVSAPEHRPAYALGDGARVGAKTTATKNHLHSRHSEPRASGLITPVAIAARGARCLATRQLPTG